MNSQSLKPDAFASAARKVEWAYQHIRNMEQVFAVAQSAGAKIIAKDDPQTPDRVELGIDYGDVLRFTPTLSMMAGDAVHNLRSALDHLAYGIVAAFEEPPSYLYFPIDIKPNSFVNHSGFRKIKELAPDIADVILKGIKPYGAGNPFVCLNQLDRADKHRTIITHAMSTQILVHMAKDDDDPIPEHLSKSGTIVLIANPTRVPKPGSLAAAHNEHNRKASFEIHFDKGLPFENEPVIPTLHQLAQAVASAVEILTTHCFGKRT